MEPFILVKFLNTTHPADDPIASLVIFEWRDRDFIGVPDPNAPGDVRQVSGNCPCARR